MLAMDFIETLTLSGQRHYNLAVIHHANLFGRRKVHEPSLPVRDLDGAPATQPRH
jgi:hypothetical protein